MELSSEFPQQIHHYSYPPKGFINIIKNDLIKLKLKDYITYNFFGHSCDLYEYIADVYFDFITNDNFTLYDYVSTISINKKNHNFLIKSIKEKKSVVKEFIFIYHGFVWLINVVKEVNKIIKPLDLYYFVKVNNYELIEFDLRFNQ